MGLSIIYIHYFLQIFFLTNHDVFELKNHDNSCETIYETHTAAFRYTLLIFFFKEYKNHKITFFYLLNFQILFVLQKEFFYLLKNL